MEQYPRLTKTDNSVIIFLTSSPFTFGRAWDCNCVIVAHSISRIHCSLEKVNNSWILKDTSTNGTWINDIVIKSGESSPLINGDIINFDNENEKYIFNLVPLDDLWYEQQYRVADRLRSEVDSCSNSHSCFTPYTTVPTYGTHRIEPAYRTEHAYTTIPTYRTGNEYTTVSEYASNPEYINNPAYSTEPACRTETAYRTEHAYTTIPTYQTGNEYTTVPEYTNNSEYASNPEYINNPAYSTVSEYATESGYPTVCERSSIPAYATVPEYTTVPATLTVTPTVPASTGDSPSSVPTEVAGPSNISQECTTQSEIPKTPSSSETNDGEGLRDEMKCSICSEMFVKAVTLNCSHTFCKFCIETWRKNGDICLICRAEITSMAPTLVLDNIIKMVIQNGSEEIKQHRKEVLEDRQKCEEQSRHNENGGPGEVPTEVAGPSNISQECTTQSEIPKTPSSSETNDGEGLRDEMKCSICSEMFVKAVTLNCSHTFCKFCIETWRKHRDICPICRAEITSMAPTLVLDNIIKMVIQNGSEEIKQHRKEVLEDRQKCEEQSRHNENGGPGEEESNDLVVDVSSEDSDSSEASDSEWGEDFSEMNRFGANRSFATTRRAADRYCYFWRGPGTGPFHGL